MTAATRRWNALEDLKGRAIVWPERTVFEDVDPYIAWADASRFAGTTVGPSPQHLPMLVRLAITKPQQVAGAMGVVTVPIRFNSAGWLYQPGKVFYGTGSIAVADILKLRPGNVVKDSKGDKWRIDAAGVMAVPRVSTLSVSALGDSFDPKISSLLPLIAVIDDGCPFAHEAYRRFDHGKPGTRVLNLWDQNGDMTSPDPSNQHWTSVPGFDYGREADRQALDKIIQTHSSSTHLDEDACYGDAGLHELVGARRTHGAHVLGLAAGAPNPALPPPCAAEAMDAAASADLIFVQLPRETMRDTSGGSLARHILDALRYIDLRATERFGTSLVRRPVVINLSVGAAAGPHDGTALIDSAIDDFLQQRPACALMIAAGNARARSMHVRLSIAEQDAAELTLQVATDDGTDSYLELWAPTVDDGGAPTKIAVRLIPPGVAADLCPWVETGDAFFLLEEGADLYSGAVAGVVNSRRTGNSAAGTMVLCTVGPTAQSNQTSGDARPLAPAGEWKIEIHNGGAGSIDIGAWIERDEPNFGGSGRQAQFDRYAAPTPLNDQTLSSLAHAGCAVVVGGYSLSPDSQLDPHSGEGSGRGGLARPGPDLIAPSNESSELPGLLSHGVHSGQFNRMGGTSVATAVATRRLYNRWIADPSEIGDGLQIRNKLKVDRARGNEPQSRVGLGRLGLTNKPGC